MCVADFRAHPKIRVYVLLFNKILLRVDIKSLKCHETSVTAHEVYSPTVDNKKLQIKKKESSETQHTSMTMNVDEN